MGANTKIEWCDFTFNHIRGCTKVAPGCANCYAEREAKRFPANRGIWGPNGTRVRASDAMWREPLKWNKNAALAAESIGPTAARPRVFCASLADVFEDFNGELHHHRVDSHGGTMQLAFDPATGQYSQWKPQANSGTDRLATLDDLRRDLFALIDATPHLDWLLLTKRPENIRRMWVPYGPNAADGEMDEYRPNVWLGTSISDQATADAMLPELLKCRDLSPVLFASYEPALGPVNIRRYFAHSMHCKSYRGGAEGFTGPECDCGAPRLKWLIVGGESGHNARPFDVAWARSAIEQCKAAGVPCFVKQLGANIVADSTCPLSVGWNEVNTEKPPTFRWKVKDKKGGDISEFPPDLQVREFPEVRHG